MVAKYDEKNVLNIHLTWNEKSEDLDNVLFTQNRISPKILYCSNMEGQSIQRSGQSHHQDAAIPETQRQRERTYMESIRLT